MKRLKARDKETDSIHFVVKLDYDNNFVVLESEKYGRTRQAINAVELFFGEEEAKSEDEYVVELYEKAEKIYNSTELDAEDKFDMILCEKISHKVNHLFSYHDPDTSYEEDTAAFMAAFKEYVDELKIKIKYT